MSSPTYTSQYSSSFVRYNYSSLSSACQSLLANEGTLPLKADGSLYFDALHSSPEERYSIRATLLNYITKVDYSSITNTDTLAAISHILSEILSLDYPENWPSAFSDLKDIASRGSKHSRVVLSILNKLYFKCFGEKVMDGRHYNINSSNDVRRESSTLRDIILSTSMPDIGECFCCIFRHESHNLVSNHSQKAARSCLLLTHRALLLLDRISYANSLLLY
jgi:hypothetical protein